MTGFVKAHGLSVFDEGSALMYAPSKKPSNRLAITPVAGNIEIHGAYGNRVVPVMYDQHDPSHDFDRRGEHRSLTDDFPYS